MIKREEVRQALENMRADVIDFRDIIDVSSYSSDADYTRIDEYITEQEKKDVFIENVKDILAFNYSYQEIGIKISKLFKQLEEEMK